MAMRQRTGLCPTAVAAIDAAVRDVKAGEACAAERDRVRAAGVDLDALRGVAGGLTCEAAIADARAMIARLQKVCDDASAKIDGKIDIAEAGARDRLLKFAERKDCGSVRDAARAKIKAIDDRVSGAQAALAALGCYTVEPPTGRFDKPTQEAIGRFQRGAHLPVDVSHLTPDFLAKLNGAAGAGACAPPTPAQPPVASLPPPANPVIEKPAPPPAVRAKPAPPPAVRENPPPHRREVQPAPERKPVVPRRPPAATAEPRPIRQAAPAHPPAAVPQAGAAIFIPN